MQQANDFYFESAALNALLMPLGDADFDTPTLFKGWTINNILRHLHVWNIAADLALIDEQAFAEMLSQLLAGGKTLRFTEIEARYLGSLSGAALRAQWIGYAEDTAQHFALADPKKRLKWVGPDMSALSSISARLMETWAHAQAVYDVLGVERVDGDHIGNIVRLGINTYGWTWKNRSEDPPGQMPLVTLTAPSGVIWTYGEASGSGSITGSATEFCQVVTQCRNIADTALVVTGDVAARWMAVAQCFAGPPQTPPLMGVRYRV